LPLAEIVPTSRRWLTAGGLFVVKPTLQTFLGFWLLMGICFACVGFMMMLF